MEGAGWLAQVVLLGWIYGSGWRGSEWEHQPQPCWYALGFQGLNTFFFIVFPFIQQENWWFSSPAASFLAPQGRGHHFYSDAR